MDLGADEVDEKIPAGDLPVRPAEAALVEVLPEPPPKRVLCTSLGRAQWARAAAQRWPQATVRCVYLDLYQAEQARSALGDQGPANLIIDCAADFPPEEVDLVALPGSAAGEAELTRDLLQQGHQLLVRGGTLLASTDNRRDTWLRGQMEQLFGTFTRREIGGCAVYIGRKQEPLRRLRDFSCRFAFRDRGRLIQAFSRPGVFAHRRVDPGARQLMEALELAGGESVLDLGCGSGSLTLAAALRAEGVRVHAVDSSARAVECTARAVELNGLANVSTQLDCSGLLPPDVRYRVVLANPPYYAAFQIAEHFVNTALAFLEPGGQLLLVTKFPDWYAAHLPARFAAAQIEPAGSYFVVRGRARE